MATFLCTICTNNSGSLPIHGIMPVVSIVLLFATVCARFTARRYA